MDVLIYQGHIENSFILYGAVAALTGNLVMLAPSLVETLKDKQRGLCGRSGRVGSPHPYTIRPARR